MYRELIVTAPCGCEIVIEIDIDAYETNILSVSLDHVKDCTAWTK